MSEADPESARSAKPWDKGPDKQLTIRKACDSCHQAKQKCSQEKPSCRRCKTSGWICRYTPRARRKNAGQAKPGSERYGLLAAHAETEKQLRALLDAQKESGVARMSFLTESGSNSSFPAAGGSSQVPSSSPPPKRSCKRRKGKDDMIHNVKFSYTGDNDPPLASNTARHGMVSRSFGEGGNGFVRRDGKGNELFMSPQEYLACIASDGHLTSLGLERFMHYFSPRPAEKRAQVHDNVQAANTQLDLEDNDKEDFLPVPLEDELPTHTSPPQPPSDAHMHSDLYDEEPFEEEDNPLHIEAEHPIGTDPNSSASHEHFITEESADMRFFARSNSMPPASSLPPLEMSSFLASQLHQPGPSSTARSQHLTEGLDLAAATSSTTNRTPTVSTFQDAAAGSMNPPHSHRQVTHQQQHDPFTTPYSDPQSIMAQHSLAFAPGSRGAVSQPPPVAASGVGVASTSGSGWEDIGLGHPSNFRTHSIQRAHSVPQSPYPTQHFGSTSQLPGPSSVIGGYLGPAVAGRTSDDMARSGGSGHMIRIGHGVLGIPHGGYMSDQHLGDMLTGPPDVDDVDVSGLLNTEMEEDENGIGHVTVVNVRSPAKDKPQDRQSTSMGKSHQVVKKQTLIGKPTDASRPEIDRHDKFLSVNGGSTDVVTNVPPLYTTCHHPADISHTLYALNSIPAPDGPSSMSLTELFPQLTRSLEILIASATCFKCCLNPQVTLGQLALLSRTCEIVRHPHPITPSPLPMIIAGGRTTMTGLAPEIEVHIVDIVWATWRGTTIQKICSALDKKAIESLERTELAKSGKKSSLRPLTEEDELDDSLSGRKHHESDRASMSDKSFRDQATLNGGGMEESGRNGDGIEPVTGSTSLDKLDAEELRARVMVKATKLLLNVLNR